MRKPRLDGRGFRYSEPRSSKQRGAMCGVPLRCPIMLFDVYERSDRRWLVVPSVLKHPARLALEGPLERLGSARMLFGRLTDTLAMGIAVNGYGVAEAADYERFRDALERVRHDPPLPFWTP